MTYINAFEDKYYVMNPKTETVLLDGRELVVGMVVLAESAIDRIVVFPGPDDRLDVEHVYAALAWNRWCRVIAVMPCASSAEIRFVGLYADGTRWVRRSYRNMSWLVKKPGCEPEFPTDE